MNTVSVLLGVHNGERTLGRCLASIAAQTVPPLEIVCVDDASTDGTAAVIARWQQQFRGGMLRCIQNAQNLGLTKSLNVGLATVRGTHVARIDADDWWQPDKLARQLAFVAARPECGVVGTGYWNIGSNRRTRIKPPESDAAIRRTMFFRNPFAHSTILFNTALVRSLGGYDTAVRYGQDYELWLRCWPHTAFANLPEPLCSRSVGAGTISAAKQRQQMLQAARTQLRYLRSYRRPPRDYLGLIEPAAVAFVPAWIRDAKRAIVG